MAGGIQVFQGTEPLLWSFISGSTQGELSSAGFDWIPGICDIHRVLGGWAGLTFTSPLSLFCFVCLVSYFFQNMLLELSSIMKK